MQKLLLHFKCKYNASCYSRKGLDQVTHVPAWSVTQVFKYEETIFQAWTAQAYDGFKQRVILWEFLKELRTAFCKLFYV